MVQIDHLRRWIMNLLAIWLITFAFIFAGCTAAIEDSDDSPKWRTGLTIDYSGMTLKILGDTTFRDLGGSEQQIQAIRVEERINGTLAKTVTVLVDPQDELAVAYYDPDRHCRMTGCDPERTEVEEFQRLEPPRPWLFGASTFIAPGVDLYTSLEMDGIPEGWTSTQKGNILVLNPEEETRRASAWGPFIEVSSLEVTTGSWAPTIVRPREGPILELETTRYEGDGTILRPLLGCGPALDVHAPADPAAFPPPPADPAYIRFPLHEAWNAVLSDWPSLQGSVLHSAYVPRMVDVTLEGNDPIFGSRTNTAQSSALWRFTVSSSDGKMWMVDSKITRTLPNETGNLTTTYDVSEPERLEPLVRFDGSLPRHRDLSAVTAAASQRLGMSANLVNVKTGVDDRGTWSEYHVSMESPDYVSLTIDVETAGVLYQRSLPGTLDCDISED